ncbi:MAG: terminase large subunit [Actinobacteria bacterium]|nr:terminase large subunit [Actinomycetota bacterium]
MADRRRFPPCGRVFDGHECRRRGEHLCVPRYSHALSFFRELLVHTKGRWARQPFIAAPWERDEVLVPLFGRVEWSAEWRCYARVYREVYLSTGRKNGKTELIAGIMLYLLCADDEESAEVYGLALDKDQAALAYSAACRMLQLSPALARRLREIKGSTRIVDESTNSFFAITAGDAMGALGPSPHGAYIDELLTQPSRDLYDALRTGFGTRVQPVLVLATTADSDPAGFAAAERAWSERVAGDPELDRRRLVVLHAVPADADWGDEANWALANPALDDYLSRETLRDEYRKAVANPEAEKAFRQFRLNQQQQQAGRALQLARWDDGALPPPPLAAAECYAGLDLASTSDLASYALDFPDGRGGHDVLYRAYAPEAAVPGLDRRTGGKASVWAAEGWLTVTEGNVIDYEAIKADMRADAETYDLREVAFDRWGATQLSSELVEEGFPLIQTGQGFATMSGPTKEFLRLVAAGCYRHGGNPLARWQAGNLVTRTDPAGNLKPDKARSPDKIDSMVAGIMALDRALRHHPAKDDDYLAAGF